MAKTYININGESRDASQITVPQDRTFRDAWFFDGDSVEVDTAKKQEILSGMVNEERERRLEKGSTISVTGYGGIPMQGRNQDQITTLALEASASALKAQGVTAAALPFRDSDNTNHLLTPDQTLELMGKAKKFAQDVYQAAWDLKDDPAGIPDDFTEDKYWP